MNYELLKSQINNKETILFIHGWGSNLENMKVLTCYQEKYNLLFIDLPGCGKTQEPNSPLLYDDYLNLIDDLVKELDIQLTYLVGHSFGGKLSIGLALRHINIKGLFLISPSIIKPKRKLNYYVKVYIYKILKKLNLLNYFNKNLFGSTDYKNASEIMKKTLVNIVNYSLEEKLIDIKQPTILLWAKNDEQTPFYMANIAKTLIKNSEIISLEGSHFAYLYQADYVKKILFSFVKGVDVSANN